MQHDNKQLGYYCVAFGAVVAVNNTLPMLSPSTENAYCRHIRYLIDAVSYLKIK